MKRNFGLIWQKEDPRDRLFAAHPMAAVDPVSLPQSVDLRDHCRPVRNQGNYGSCTGHGVGNSLEFIAPDVFDQDGASVAYLYWWGRAAIGTTAEDSGAMIRDVIKGVNRQGCPEENLWPYDRDHLFREPDPDVQEMARHHKVVEYHAVNTARIDEMRACLAGSIPFVFGMALYRSFDPDNDGVIPMPKKRDKELGGHCMACVGYHHRPKAGDPGVLGKWPDAWGPGLFIVRNSWGKDWGVGGYCYVPYAMMCEESHDAWAITAVEKP